MERMEDEKVLISAVFTACCLVCCLSLSSTYKLGACCNLVHLTFVHLMNKYAVLFFLTCILISPKWMRTNLSSTCLVCSVNVYEPQDGNSVFFLPGKDCRWEPESVHRTWLRKTVNCGGLVASCNMIEHRFPACICMRFRIRSRKKRRDRKTDEHHTLFVINLSFICDCFYILEHFKVTGTAYVNLPCGLCFETHCMHLVFKPVTARLFAKV